MLFYLFNLFILMFYALLFWISCVEGSGVGGVIVAFIVALIVGSTFCFGFIGWSLSYNWSHPPKWYYTWHYKTVVARWFFRLQLLCGVIVLGAVLYSYL